MTTRSCDGERLRWKEAPELPAGFACVTAVVWTWLAAPIQRLPSLGGPDCQVFIHGPKWVSHFLPSMPCSAFLINCSGTTGPCVRWKSQFCPMMILKVTLKEKSCCDELPECSHMHTALGWAAWPGYQSGGSKEERWMEYLKQTLGVLC